MVRGDVENLCKTALDKFGRVDFVVNNARYVGPELFDPFLQFEIDTWQKHIAVDLLAPVIISKLCLPSMIRNKSGMIINVTASVAHHDVPGMPGGGGGLCAAYPTMKAALDRFVVALAKETRPYGIPVIAFDPGAVMNERFALEDQADRNERAGYEHLPSAGRSGGGVRILVLRLSRPDALHRSGGGRQGSVPGVEPRVSRARLFADTLTLSLVRERELAVIWSARLGV